MKPIKEQLENTLIYLNNHWITFDEKKHVYTDNEYGNFLTGTTTIIAVKEKKYLRDWKLNLAIDFLKNYLFINKEYTKKEKEELLDKAKNAAKSVSDRALDIGSTVHWELHLFILSKINKISLEEVREIMKEKRPENLPKLDKIGKRCLDNFLKWESEHKIEWLATEVLVGDRELGIGGIIDFIAMVDDKLTLGDFKTNKQISSDAFLQTAGYQYQYEKCLSRSSDNSYMYSSKIDQRMIINLSKESGLIETMIVPTNIKEDIKAFLACVEMYRWEAYSNRIHNPFIRKGVVKKKWKL